MFSMGEFSDKMKIENCWKTVSGRAAERDVLIVSCDGFCGERK